MKGGGGQIIKGVLPSGDKLLKNGVVDISECLWYVPVIWKEMDVNEHNRLQHYT